MTSRVLAKSGLSEWTVAITPAVSLFCIAVTLSWIAEKTACSSTSGLRWQPAETNKVQTGRMAGKTRKFMSGADTETLRQFRQGGSKNGERPRFPAPRMCGVQKKSLGTMRGTGRTHSLH